ncbi:MAG: hypothetical protein EBT86_06260 [Actinobacteria bacterium]|nr:hypothetical protein [Actinomycetota bacterium]
MGYTRGTNSNIIVGAAAFFVTRDSQSLSAATIPGFVGGESYKTSLTDRYATQFRNVGYTNNGLEITFAPDFGEVMVDQLLDTAKIFKQGMKVTLKTTLAEATLENLLLAIAGKDVDYQPGIGNLISTVSEVTFLANLTNMTQLTVGNLASITSNVTLSTVGTLGAVTDSILDINSGDLGDYPVERGIIAVGPGLGNKDGFEATSPTTADQQERVYIAYRAVSIDSVTVSAKRDSATAFEVSFRLLPDDTGSYGKIVDRTF